MWKWLLVVFLVLVAAGGVLLYLKSNGPEEYPFAKATVETLVSNLHTNGKAEPLEWAALRSEQSGRVETVLVHEGDIVPKGALLAQMASSQAEGELAAAQARMEQAKAQLEAVARGGKSAELAEIDSNLDRARFDYESARKEHESLGRLVAKGAAAPFEADRARERLEQRKLEIQALERKRKALVTAADRSVAEAQVREAETAAELARRRIERNRLLAPMAGTLYTLAVRPGSYLNPGDMVASVGHLDRMRVRVFVDEPELGRVALGQTVTITWDASAVKKNWSGTVERLAASVEPVGMRQVGEVLCTIENPDRDLVPGANVNVEIRSSVVPDALTIPKEALRREANETGVWALDGETIAWRQVRVGISSVTRTQVVSGLKAGEPVALPTEKPLRAGVRIRAIYP